MPDTSILFLVVESTLVLTPMIGISFYSFLSTKNTKHLSAQHDFQAIQSRMQKTFHREFSSSYKSSSQHFVGKFRLIDFCARAEVDGVLGKEFLQKQVAEFAGIIDIDDFGDIHYYFGDAKANFIEKNGNE